MPAGAASLYFSRSLWLHFLRPAERLTQWMRSVFEIFLEASSNLFHSSLQGYCLVPYRKRYWDLCYPLALDWDHLILESKKTNQLPRPSNNPLCLLSSHQKEQIWPNIPDHSLVLHSKGNIFFFVVCFPSSKLNCKSQGQQVTWDFPLHFPHFVAPSETMNVPSICMCGENGFLSDSITLASDTNTVWLLLPCSFLITFALMLADLLTSQALPRELQRLGSPVPKSQGALSVTQGFCLNISQAANPPVKADSVGEHICKTKQGCGRPGSLWLARWIIHSRPCRVTDAHSGSEALFITKLGFAVFRYPPSPFRCPFRF